MPHQPVNHFPPCGVEPDTQHLHRSGCKNSLVTPEELTFPREQITMEGETSTTLPRDMLNSNLRQVCMKTGSAVFSEDIQEERDLCSSFISSDKVHIGANLNVPRPNRPTRLSEYFTHVEANTDKCNQNSPIVDIQEEPEEEDDDSEPIMFEFDKLPCAIAPRAPSVQTFVRPVPLKTGAVHEKKTMLDTSYPNGTIFRPISARIPRSLSLSPCSSPIHSTLSRSPSPAWSMSNLSPSVARRRRGRTLTANRNIDAILGVSPPVRIPRDPIQPTSGSISDVHSEASFDDEESDLFPLEPMPRQRSSTCPESRSWRRRVRARSMNRPPTPPPGGADDQDVEKMIGRLVVKDKLKIPTRELPRVPEFPNTVCPKTHHSSPNLSLK